MRAVGQADRPGRAGDFLHRNHVGQKAHAAATVFLGDGDAEQAHLAEFPPQIGRKQIVMVDLGRARRDFLFGKGVNGFTQQVDVFSEGERTH
jgi:hypothetical protein